MLIYIDVSLILLHLWCSFLCPEDLLKASQNPIEQDADEAGLGNYTHFEGSNHESEAELHRFQSYNQQI